MAQDDFLSGYLDAVSKIHEIKRRKQKDEWDTEDRGIEKDLLSHRLRTIKINEKVMARKAAMENAAILEGQPESSFPWQGDHSTDREGASPLGPGFGTMHYPRQEPPSVPIPGIDELGVPGVTDQPRSLEEGMRQQGMTRRMQARSGLVQASRGERVRVPGATEADAPEYVEGQEYQTAGGARTKSVRREVQPDGSQIETDVYFDRDGNLILEGETRHIPKRQVSTGGSSGGRVNAAGGTATMLSESEQEAAVRMFMKGTPLDVNPKSAIGLRNLIALEQAGADIPVMMADQTAYANYLKGVTTNEKRQEIAEATGVMSEALGNMDKLLEDPNASDEDIDLWAEVIRSYAPVIKPGGSNNTAAEIAKAEEFFKPGFARRFRGNKATYEPMMKKLRAHLAVRMQSINSVFQPVGSPGGPSPPPGRGVVPPPPPGGGGVVPPPGADPNEPPPLADSAPGDLGGMRNQPIGPNGFPTGPPAGSKARAYPSDGEIGKALRAHGQPFTAADIEHAKRTPAIMNALFPPVQQ